MPEEKKFNCVVFDIDNTLVDMNPVFKEIFQKRLDHQAGWDYFEANCDRKDIAVKEHVLDMAKFFHEQPDFEVVFLTARSETVEEKTRNFLDKLGFEGCPLIMRELTDTSLADNYKKKNLRYLQDIYNIIMFLDDEINNREAAKSLGIFSPRPDSWRDLSVLLPLVKK